MIHVIAWMTPLEEGLRPHQLQNMLMYVSQDCELSETFELSANNSAAHIFFDLTALEDLGIELEQAKAEVSQTLLPVLENWEHESEDCFYTTPTSNLRIFMGCDQATLQSDGRTTGVVEELSVAATFRELRDALNTLSDEQLDSNLTVYDGNDDEFYAVTATIKRTPELDVLDRNHPYIQFTYTFGGEEGGQ
jgi:hypothetical protein